VYQIKLVDEHGRSGTALMNAYSDQVVIAIFARPQSASEPFPDAFHTYVTYGNTGTVDTDGIPIYRPVDVAPLTVALTEGLAVRALG
jgi:hypothetical protein